MPLTFLRAISAFLLFATLLVSPLSHSHAQSAPSDRLTAISGLLLAPGEKSQASLSLYLATPYGLVRAKPDGMMSLVPVLNAGLVSLTASPENPAIMLASGYDAKSKKIGVMKSSDGGGNWTQLSDGASGADALQSITISAADPQVVYALGNGLQVSKDGGRLWKSGGNLPDNVIAVAASSVQSQTLYAAAKGGVFVSRDGGGKWLQADKEPGPATLIHAAPGGKLYAFIYGRGLVTAEEPELEWTLLSKEFGSQVLLNFAIDPGDPERLYATVDTGAIVTSNDGGKTWISFEGSDKASPENIATGKQLYEENCVACHGVDGVGESPHFPMEKDEYGFKAPALNNDSHGWHHSDKNIAEAILKGSPQNERMVAFRDSLSDEDVDNLIAYIKSLWNFRSISCQGKRHMACNR